MLNNPLLLGVTGGIGSGKSTVCHILSVIGYKVYDADSRAKTLMVTSRDIVQKVKTLFGDKAYSNGQLDRKLIAAKAFHDQSLLSQLNETVHPVVKIDFDKWVATNGRDNMLVKEAALLIETGSYQDLDTLILVSAPTDIRIQRVLTRDPHRKREEVVKIMEKQMSDDEKRKYADYEIVNDGSKSLIKSVMEIERNLFIT